MRDHGHVEYKKNSLLKIEASLLEVAVHHDHLHFHFIQVIFERAELGAFGPPVDHVA